MSTKIEWTDETWNPVRGCSRVSEGCRNCYAERTAARGLPGMVSPTTGRSFARMTPSGPRWIGNVELIESKLDEPLHWTKPRRIFVNSMSDLFHEGLSNEEIASVFGVMAGCREHTFQVLTKRPERMRAWFGWIASTWPRMFPGVVPDEIDANVALQFLPNEDRFQIEGRTYGEDYAGDWPLSNVWLGVSVENQAAADERIPLLLQTPAAVRFLSCEPLLGPLDLKSRLPSSDRRERNVHVGCPRIDWVIAGGESGPGARPMNPDWARSLRDQCTAAGVPFFFKQWGEWGSQYSHGRDAVGLFPDGSRYRANEPDGYQFCASLYRVGKKAAGRELDGRTWDEFPAGVA